MTSDSGRHFPSAHRWIFVVRPPRDRPRASPGAPPPPAGRKVSGTSCPGLAPLDPPLRNQRVTADPCGPRRRVGVLAPYWSPPPPPSRCHPHCPRPPAPAGTAAPTCRPPTTCGVAHAPSSTARSIPAGHATAPRYGSGAKYRRSPDGDRATDHNGRYSQAGTAVSAPTPHPLTPHDLPCTGQRVSPQRVT
jgi:hypothetical protein